MKTVGLLIAIILFYRTIYGQELASQPVINYPAEEIQVHLTQTYLFPGEVMGFNVYCTNPLFPELELSRVAFIEVVSEQNTSILRKKILLEHGAGGGEFMLPDNVNTGIYTVLAYTNWLKNFGEESFHMQNIMIVNPDQGMVQVTDTGNSLQYHSDPGDSDNLHAGIMIIPDKHQYATRERVSLKVKLVNGEGPRAGGIFSVSVSRTEPALYREQFETSKRRMEIQANEIEYLPDFMGIRLTGKLEDPSGNAMQGARIIISEPGPGTKINSTLSDSEGRFHFLLQPQEGVKDIVFTLPENNAIIKLEEPFWNGFRNPPVQPGPFLLHGSTASFLEEKFFHYQLQHKFNQSNFSEHKHLDEYQKDNERFYTHYSRSIRMDDYVLLDSLPEYFYELVPSVKFVQNKGKYDIKVLDRVSASYYEEKPGVFVDGVLYSDYNQIARIPVQEIEHINILPEFYYYRDFSFGGIIDLHTKKSDFTTVQLLPNMIRLIFPLASKAEMRYDAPDHTHPDTLSRIPDFRYVICWEPDVTIEPEGEKTIQFYTGDVTGEFTIKVCGISPEGKIIHSETKIFVGKVPGK